MRNDRPIEFYEKRMCDNLKIIKLCTEIMNENPDSYVFCTKYISECTDSIKFCKKQIHDKERSRKEI